ncbi:hypothetical protein BGZ76_000867, partial [Entomortierella beljakovae]
MAPPRTSIRNRKPPPGSSTTAAKKKNTVEKLPHVLDPENETEAVDIQVDQETADAKAWIKENVEKEVARIRSTGANIDPVAVKNFGVVVDLSRKKATAINRIEISSDFDFKKIQQIMVSSGIPYPHKENYEYVNVLLFGDGSETPMLAPYLYDTKFKTQEPVEDDSNEQPSLDQRPWINVKNNLTEWLLVNSQHLPSFDEPDDTTDQGESSNTSAEATNQVISTAGQAVSATNDASAPSDEVEEEEDEASLEVCEDDDFSLPQFTDEDRKTFAETFLSLHEKVTLPSGLVLEDVLFSKGVVKTRHHLIHSFIIDVDDMAVRDMFAPSDWEFIVKEQGLSVSLKDQDIIDILKRLKQANSPASIMVVLQDRHTRLGEGFAMEHDYDLKWILDSVSKWLDLYVMPFPVFTSDAPLEYFWRSQAWGVLDTLFFDISNILMIGGESAGLESTARRNEQQQGRTIRKLTG